MAQASRLPPPSTALLLSLRIPLLLCHVPRPLLPLLRSFLRALPAAPRCAMDLTSVVFASICADEVMVCVGCGGQFKRITPNIYIILLYIIYRNSPGGQTHPSGRLPVALDGEGIGGGIGGGIGDDVR